MDAISIAGRQSGTLTDYDTIANISAATDQALLLQVEQQSRAALEQLYDRHCRLTMGIAMRILNDRARADRVVLEAFWWLWQNPTLAECQDGNFTDWFSLIVRHLALAEFNRVPNSPLLPLHPSI